MCSRLGQAKIVFHPYKTEQIQTIIQHRLEPVPDVFDASSIRFAARKVGGVSGDVRRSLELLRQASELWLRDTTLWEQGGRQGSAPGPKVAMKHAAEAHKAMFAAAHFTVRPLLLLPRRDVRCCARGDVCCRSLGGTALLMLLSQGTGLQTLANTTSEHAYRIP